MPAPSTTEGIYYLRLNGKVEGPFTIGQIYDLWAARKINSQTHFARFEEMDKWQPLSELTLKISSPKPSPAKQAAPPSEPVSHPPPPRARPAVPAARPQEYIPPIVFPVEEKPSPAPRRAGRDPVTVLQSRLLKPSVAIGACIAVGALLVLYFAFLYPAPGRRETLHDLLVIKQTGVFSGIGLILMGGLLLVAQQVARLKSAIESASGKPQSKPQNSS